jgi:hypothetical protein
VIGKPILSRGVPLTSDVVEYAMYAGVIHGGSRQKRKHGVLRRNARDLDAAWMQ